MAFERFEVINRSLLLCGCGRSGTTILGKLTGTFEGVEYFFEPAFMHKFMYAHQRMDAALWKEVFEWYCYDDLLVGAIAGRNLNWNTHDDSCVLNFKGEEVKKRLSKSHRKTELDMLAQQHRLAFKIPDLLFHVPFIRALYPGIKAVAMHRNADDNILSIYRKKWFDDAALHVNSPMPQIDFYLDGEIRVPRWLAPSLAKDWLACDALNRSAWYYAMANEYIWQHRKHYFILHYDRWVENPAVYTHALCRHLGTERSEMTTIVESTIKMQDIPREAIMHHLRNDIRERVQRVSELFNTHPAA